MLNWFKSTSREWPHVSFSKYFQFKRHDIHDYGIRNKDKLVINRVKLESTKRAFFYKGADIFIIVYESSSSLFISFYMHILRFLYSFFDFYILNRLFCYLFMSLFYTGPILMSVFITEMVILHKYVFIIIIIIIIVKHFA